VRFRIPEKKEEGDNTNDSYTEFGGVYMEVVASFLFSSIAFQIFGWYS